MLTLLIVMTSITQVQEESLSTCSWFLQGLEIENLGSVRVNGKSDLNVPLLEAPIVWQC